jgi:HEAT repeats
LIPVNSAPDAPFGVAFHCAEYDGAVFLMRATPFCSFIKRLQRGFSCLSFCAALFVAFTQNQSSAAQGPDIPNGARITVVGSALADVLLQDGFLETAFLESFPEKNLAFRSLAIPGATVPRADSDAAALQQAHLAQIGTRIVWAFYGTTEALCANPDIASFQTDLLAFANRTLSSTPNSRPMRLILFGPAAQEPLGDAVGLESNPRNAQLKSASDAVATVAKEVGVPFVDVFSATERLFATRRQRAALVPKFFGLFQSALTVHGYLPTTEGNRLLAPLIFEALTGTAPKKALHLEAIRKITGDKHSAWRRAFQQMPPAPSPEVWQPLEDRASALDALAWAHANGTPVEKAPPAPGTITPAKPVFIATDANSSLFASSDRFPELSAPIRTNWDAQGRLWVLCDSPDRETGKLLVLGDLDGDGVADRCSIFAAELGAVTDFTFYCNGVLLIEDGDVWFLRDPKQSGHATQKERLLTGLGISNPTQARQIALDASGSVLLKTASARRARIEAPEGGVPEAADAVYRLDPRSGHVEELHNFRFPGEPLKEPQFSARDSNGTFLTGEKPPQWTPALGEQPVAQLLEHLKTREPAALNQVRNELASRPAKEIQPALLAWIAQLDATDPATESLRLEALRLLRWFGELHEPLLTSALHSPNASVRQEAVRIVREARDTLPDAVARLESLAQDADIPVRLEVLDAASYFAPHQPDAVRLVHRVLAQPLNPVLEHAAHEVLQRLEPDPTRILIPENNQAQRFVLTDLSNERLALAPGSESVWLEQIQREGMPAAIFDSGLHALAKLHQSSLAAEIAAVLLRLEVAGAQEKAPFEKLMQLLLETPAGELAPAERALETLAATSHLARLRCIAHAAWLRANGRPQSLWTQLETRPARQIELLEALPLIPEPALRAAFHPLLAATLQAKAPAPKLLDAALAALHLTGTEFNAENFALLQALLLQNRAIPQTALALTYLPSELWTADIPEPDKLLTALRLWLDAVPKNGRAEPPFKTTLKVARQFANCWKEAAAVAAEHLDSLQQNP